MSKAWVFREINEEDGLGDVREGEFRTAHEGNVTTQQDTPQEVLENPDEWEILSTPIGNHTVEAGESADTEQEAIRRHFAESNDDPNLRITRQDEENFTMGQNVKVDDSKLDSPFLFCMAREPSTKSEWDAIRDALPDRYDTWTVTEDINQLKFEIEHGIKKWLGLNLITKHQIGTQYSWVEYSYDEAPPSEELDDLLKMNRWFRKRRRYRFQQEFRFEWNVSSTQMEIFPNVMDIELTKTGLALFTPWDPPTE